MLVKQGTSNIQQAFAQCGWILQRLLWCIKHVCTHAAYVAYAGKARHIKHRAGILHNVDEFCRGCCGGLKQACMLHAGNARHVAVLSLNSHQPCENQNAKRIRILVLTAAAVYMCWSGSTFRWEPAGTTVKSCLKPQASSSHLCTTCLDFKYSSICRAGESVSQSGTV